MKTLTLVALLASLTALNVSAHPGRTASDGCHYCRTNCAQWGETQGARHCHGGLKVEPSIEVMESAATNKYPAKLEGALSQSRDATHSHPHENPEQQYN